MKLLKYCILCNSIVLVVLCRIGLLLMCDILLGRLVLGGVVFIWFIWFGSVKVVGCLVILLGEMIIILVVMVLLFGLWFSLYEMCVVSCWVRSVVVNNGDFLLCNFVVCYIIVLDVFGKCCFVLWL